MTRYIALVDGKPGAYGVAFPDADGCTAMGETMDEALHNATLALAEWVKYSDDKGFTRPVARAAEELRADPEVAEQLANGAAFAIIPLLLESGRLVRANLSIDDGFLTAIDEAATHAGLTRSAFLISAARDKILHSV